MAFPVSLISSPEPYVYYPMSFETERHRSQFYSLPFLVNPAMTGSVSQSCLPTGRFYLNQRFQTGRHSPSYPNSNPRNSTYIAYDQYVPQLRGGIGLMATHNSHPTSVQTHSTINLMYSYVIPVSDNFTLRTGVQATVGQRHLDLTEYSSPYSMQHIATDRITYSNFSSGVMGYSKRFFAGISVHNLNERDVSFYNSPWLREYDQGLLRRYSLQSGLEIPLGKKEAGFTLSPNVIVFYQKSYSKPYIHLGTYVNKGIWTAAVWYSSNYDAIMILLGIQKGRFRVAYSFDSNVEPLNVQQKAHELTISFDLFYGNQIRHKGNNLCRIPIPAF
jgi:type IX secretion system PorP/SprF family membrane protein